MPSYVDKDDRLFSEESLRKAALATLSEEEKRAYEASRCSIDVRNRKTLDRPISDDRLLELIEFRSGAFARLCAAQRAHSAAQTKAADAAVAEEAARMRFALAEAPVIDEMWRRGMMTKL